MLQALHLCTWRLIKLSPSHKTELLWFRVKNAGAEGDSHLIGWMEHIQACRESVNTKLNFVCLSWFVCKMDDVILSLSLMMSQGADRY